MKSNVTYALIACSILAGSTIAGCSSSSSGGSAAPKNCKPVHANVHTLSKGQLQVAFYVSPPYTYQNGNKFSGIDQQVIKKIAAEECLSLKETPSTGAALIAGIQSKRADVAIGGIYKTAARAEVVNLTSPIYRDGMAIMSKKGSSSLADLTGENVGAIQGALWNGDLQKVFGSKFHVYQGFDGVVADLKSGRLDSAILGSAEAAYHVKQTPGYQVKQLAPTPKVPASETKNDVVFALTKGNDSLTSAMDDDITKQVSDGSVRAALSKYGMDPTLAGPAS